MKKWDYAEMSKEAKKHGGPEQYMEEYGQEKFNEGRIVGEEIGEHRGRIEGTVGTLAITGIIMFIIKIIEKRKQKKALKLSESQEISEASKQKIIEGIKCYDAEHPDSNDEEKEEC